MNKYKSKKEGNLSKNRQKRKRNKNTLKDLARNFLDYMKEEKGKVLKIDDVVKKLEFSKRRIYDITNVLEGIGIIKKREKNKIEIISKQYLDSESLNERFNNEFDNLLKEENDLKQEEKMLDIWIKELIHMYSEKSKSEEFNKLCYLNYEHLKSLCNDNDLNFIGINAPKNSKIFIPDPSCIDSLYNYKLKEISNHKDRINPHENELINMLSRKHHLFLETPEACKSEIQIYMLLSSNTISD